MNWEEAAKVAGMGSAPEPLVKQPERDEAPALVVVDHFSPSMIVGLRHAGATVVFRELNRLEALELAREHRAEIGHVQNERTVAFLERELQLKPPARPQLRLGHRLLVGELIRWNDVRWYLVEYLCDADGVVE